jgi:hypothetical protein
MKGSLGALVLVLGLGCAGPSSPTSLRRDLAEPATALGIVPGATVQIVSGETGQPVGGARIVIAGRELVTDGAGEVLVEQLAPNGATIDIVAPGFLDRQTLVRRGERTVFELWPSQSPTRLDASYTRALVYESAAIAGGGGVEPLDRPDLDTARVALVPGEAILRNAPAMQALRGAAAEITGALEGAIVYSVGETPGAVRVSLVVEPQNESIVEENLRALTRCWMTRLVITRCEIVYRDVEVVRSNTTLHELGHTFGLNHSPDRAEIMGVRRLASPEQFSQRERLAMRLMLKRPPGNLFPDNDRQAPALRARGETSRIVCRHPD